VHPWWPDAVKDPEAHRRIAAAFAQLMEDPKGSYTVPVSHRDGHRLWVSASFNHAHDPGTGRQVTVGTFRDVTAEHYAVRRKSAQAALGLRLTQATSLPEALSGALAELRSVWRAETVLAALSDG